jgi:hypothetical protein
MSSEDVTMTDANPEVMVLWRAESAIRLLLQECADRIHTEERYALQELLPELERIRLLRVARWNARKRAKQMKRRASLVESNAMNRYALEVLKRAAKRDHTNGDVP